MGEVDKVRKIFHVEINITYPVDYKDEQIYDDIDVLVTESMNPLNLSDDQQDHEISVEM